ncbi:MAG: hypothetical protein IT379_05415 [Deltaproteobacteria bacterium]|nr:hypothetical protein [Deltaproteobacteria bacterium]
MRWLLAWTTALGLAACGASCGSSPPAPSAQTTPEGRVRHVRDLAQPRCGPATDEPPDPATAQPSEPGGPSEPGAPTPTTSPPGEPVATPEPSPGGDATDAPPAMGGPTDPRRFVPRIDAATKTRLRQVLAQGARAGLRSDVFSKVGDSISESWSFGRDLGMGWVEWGRWGFLRPTLERFRRVVLARDGNDALNAFSVQSLAATAGWEASDAVTPSPDRGGRTPIVAEVARTRGAFAIVMFGTNDLERRSDAHFGASLRRVVDELARRHVIVVLSTIPPRRDDPRRGAQVGPFNAQVRAVAQATGVLLTDYHGAIARLPNQGMSDDGVHPSTFRNDSAGVLTDEGLRHGYNVRNLLWLLTLEKLTRIVVEDGAPD